MLHTRRDFPFLQRTVNGTSIAYLDNAATTQKPRLVIDRVLDLYRSGIANVHRAVSFLADEVTQAFEDGRERTARFLGAQSREIVFLNNATQGINLVSHSIRRGGKALKILTTTQEHHSNSLGCQWPARFSALG